MTAQRVILSSYSIDGFGMAQYRDVSGVADPSGDGVRIDVVPRPVSPSGSYVDLNYRKLSGQAAMPILEPYVNYQRLQYYWFAGANVQPLITTHAAVAGGAQSVIVKRVTFDYWYPGGGPAAGATTLAMLWSGNIVTPGVTTPKPIWAARCVAEAGSPVARVDSGVLNLYEALAGGSAAYPVYVGLYQATPSLAGSGVTYTPISPDVAQCSVIINVEYYNDAPG